MLPVPAADCQHEIRRLTNGWRLALVYNLIHSGQDELPAAVDYSPAIRAMEQAVAAWQQDEKRPKFLVHMLEHKWGLEDQLAESMLA